MEGYITKMGNAYIQISPFMYSLFSYGPSQAMSKNGTCGTTLLLTELRVTADCTVEDMASE